MGLDFTGNMNYQQMQHIDAGAALQNTLRGMVDDRTKSAEMAAKLARQEQDRQDTLLQRGVENTRADANLLLNQNEATRKAQQDEYTMQLKASEMGLTSDYRLADLAAKAEENKNTAAYRKSTQELTLKDFNARRGDVASALAKDEGEAYGESQLLNGEVVDKNPLAEKVLKDKAIEESNRLQGMVGDKGAPMGKEKRYDAYTEYLKKNKEDATKVLSPFDKEEKLRAKGNKLLASSPLKTSSIVGNVRSAYDYFFNEKSEVDQRNTAKDSILNPEIQPKVLSEAEFYKQLDDKTKYEQEAKDSIKQWLAGQGNYATEDKGNEQYLRDMGVIVPDTEATVTRDYTKGEIQANNDKLLSDYKVNHPNASKSELLGVRQGINKNTKKLLEDRDAVAKVRLTNTIKAFDKQQEYAYKKALEKYKSELKEGEEVSLLEMARIAQYMANTKLLDAKTFTEKDK